MIEPGINLLHIDGWHTYRAVSTDFKQFKPLLAPGAIVMFHDVNAPWFRGMRLFWRQISWMYPAVLIPYSSGLGIIQYHLITARSMDLPQNVSAYAFES